MNRHLNLFYSYDKRECEDNVTRALVIALQNLNPVLFRLFLRDVLLQKYPSGRWGSPLDGFDLFSAPSFEFDLQLQPIEGDERLRVGRDLLVGITKSGTADISKSRTTPIATPSPSDEQGRPDALVADRENDVTVLFESKLGDDLYREQLERHCQTFFDKGAGCLDDVFVQVSWNEIGDFLDRLVTQSRSHDVGDRREAYVLDSFLNHLDMLHLVRFRPFRADDFGDRSVGANSRKLASLMELVGSELTTRIGTCEYTGNSQFRFPEVLHENIWVDFGRDGGLCAGIVCGSGKKWRAGRLRDCVQRDRHGFRELVQDLRDSIDPRFAVYLRAHGLFYVSRFRTALLLSVGGDCRFPEGFDAFCDVLTDPKRNSHHAIERDEINTLFREDIDRCKAADSLVLGEDQKFPRWANVNKYGQYLYAHIDVEIPRSAVIGRDGDTMVKLFETVVSALRVAARALDTYLN